MLNMFTPRSLSIGSVQGSPTMYSRTYQLNSTENNLNELLRTTNNGNNVNVNSVMGASDIMGMSSDASAQIDIEGGWHEHRHIFTMVLESSTTGTLYILTGFTTTDYMINGQINPRALVKFNTFTEMARQVGPDGNPMYTPVATDNIMAQTSLIGGGELANAVSARPTDVLSASSLYGIGDEGENITSIAQHSTNGSTARNNQAAAWLGRSMNSFMDAMDSVSLSGSGHSYMGESDANMIANHAAQAGNITETDLTRAPLIGSILNNFHDMKSGEVTWAELLRQLPQLANLVQPPLPAGGGSKVSLAEWNNRDTAIIMSEYASAIPALMLELGITTFDHTISNANQGYNADPMSNGGASYMINGDANTPGVTFSVPNANAVEILRRAEIRIRDMIFPRISKGHNMTISCRASVLSEMTIAVNWNGYEFVHSAPTWASSMWGATMATVHGSTSLANGMGKLANKLVDSRGNAVSPQPSQNQSAPQGRFGDPIDDLFN